MKTKQPKDNPHFNIYNKDEIKIFYDAFNVLQESIDERTNNIYYFMREGVSYGLIPQSGDEFTKHGQPLYELRQKILDKLADDNQKIIDLRNKFIKLNNTPTI